MKRAAVLIVDDSVVNIQVLAGILGEEFDLLVATSGEDAVEIAQREKVDMVLLDIMLPEMDGYQVCNWLKNYPPTSNVPVIFITSLNSDRVEIKGLKMGAVDFISKPFHEIVVRTRVRNHLKLYQQTRMLEKLVSMDSLTNIANRRKFDETLNAEWARGLRNGLTLGLVMFDIDYFKNYNDCYGHGLGDECLRKLSAGINSIPRRPTDLLARYGGEEFVMLMPETGNEGIIRMSMAIRQTVNDMHIPHKASPLTDHVTVSVGGVSATPSESISAEHLKSGADKQLYLAKNRGRDRWQTLDLNSGTTSEPGQQVVQ